MRFALPCACLFLCLFQLDALAEEKLDPRANINKLLERVIELHEKQDYVTYFKECVNPTEREAILKKSLLENETLEDFVKRNYYGKAPMLYFPTPITAWKQNRDITPTLNEEQTIATYPTQTANMSMVERLACTLVFEKVGTQWYVSLTKTRAQQVVQAKKKPPKKP